MMIMVCLSPQCVYFLLFMAGCHCFQISFCGRKFQKGEHLVTWTRGPLLCGFYCLVGSRCVPYHWGVAHSNYGCLVLLFWFVFGRFSCCFGTLCWCNLSLCFIFALFQNVSLSTLCSPFQLTFLCVSIVVFCPVSINKSTSSIVCGAYFRYV